MRKRVKLKVKLSEDDEDQTLENVSHPFRRKENKI